MPVIISENRPFENAPEGECSACESEEQRDARGRVWRARPRRRFVAQIELQVEQSTGNTQHAIISVIRSIGASQRLEPANTINDAVFYRFCQEHYTAEMIARLRSVYLAAYRRAPRPEPIPEPEPPPLPSERYRDPDYVVKRVEAAVRASYSEVEAEVLAAEVRKRFLT